jgi:hypothetical protein
MSPGIPFRSTTARKRNADTASGVAVNQATIEGMIMATLEKLGTGKAGSGSTAMWIALAVIFPCVVALAYLAKNMIGG